MTQAEANNRILDSTFVLVIRWDEMRKLGLTFQEVIGAWNQGIILDQNIYTLKKKVDVIKELQTFSE